MSTSGAGAGPSTRPAKASSPPPLLVTSGPNAKPHDLEHASTSSTKLFTLSKRLRGKLPAFNARLVTDGDSKRDILELGQLLDIPTSKVTPSQCGPALSEQEARSRSGKSPPQPPPNKVDANSHQAALLQSARRKVSLQDEEAIRKARITMMELSNSSSSSASWRSDPSFPAEAQEPPSGQLGSMEDYEDSSRTPTCSTGDRIASNGDVPIAQTSTNTTGVNEEALDHAQSPPAVNTDLVIAVVGHRGVGKSTVIRKAVRAWGVSEPVIVVNPAGHILCSSFSMIQPGGKLQNALKVEFVEMNMAALNLSETSQSIWPTLLTRASGVILCYDALRQNTLQGIAPLLERLSAEEVPAVMLACKSDPDIALQVAAMDGNALAEPFNIGLIEVTTATADGRGKIRNGLRWLLYKLEQRHRRPSMNIGSNQLNGVSGRNRREPVVNSIIAPSPASSHHPSMYTETIKSPETDSSFGARRLVSHHHIGMSATNSTQSTDSEMRRNSSSLTWMKKAPLRYPGGPMELASGSSDQGSLARESLEIIGTSEPSEDTHATRKTPHWASLEDLCTQLFTAIVSADDDSFGLAFFMTYRRFCEPQEVMAEFLDRFRMVEGHATPNEVRHWALVRMTGALFDWSSRYPGDLSGAETQKLFRETLAVILKYTFMAHLIADLVLIEQSLPDLADVDASWSLTSAIDFASASKLAASESQFTVNGDQVNHSGSSLDGNQNEQSVTKETSYSSHSLSTPTLNVGNDAAAPTYRKMHGSAPILLDQPGKLDNPDDDARSSGWTAAMAYLLNNEPRAIAMELARMQWRYFRAVRPRDVFRHDFGKERDSPVGRSIDYFNHLSRWVSTLILADPRPKLRAHIYERFVLIIHQLRHLKDYETLYAVISGIRETSVQRLSQTYQLVQLPLGIEQEFQGYLALFDPGGGYVRYRRAIQADLADGQAAIPVLTSILGLVNRLQTVRPEDKRADGAIQWDKFARFGEILSIIPVCQSKGPFVSGEPSDAFRRILEDTTVISSEDKLFERSRMLEPQRGGMGAGGGSGGNNVLRRLASMGL